jgi:hypothetical protein
MRTLIASFAICAALTACKKKDDTTAPAAGSGSMTAPGSGSAAMTPPPAGSAGSGSAAMAGSGSAEGSGSAAMTPPTGAPGPRPASVTDAQVALADKAVGIMEKLGTDLTAAGTDCKKASAAIKTAAADLKPIKEEADKMKEQTDKDPAAKEWFMNNYGKRMMSVAAPMMTLAQKCSKDPEFMASIKELDMGGRKHDKK